MGKLALSTTLGGVRPSTCLPITNDITMWKTEFVVKLLWLHFPPSFEEYYDFLHEFMSDVKQNYGKKILIQFEDFASHNAFELLVKYRTTHLVFNDDIQGTTSVILAGIIASLKLLEVHNVINILFPRCWRDIDCSSLK
ncbi:NADP-dependent malic enzyme isoform X1 [Capsicum galapagoense]